MTDFAILGRTRVMLDTARQAVAAGHRCALVVTCQAPPEYSVGPSDFERLAADLGCPYLYLADGRLRADLPAISACQAEIGLSINWLRLVPESVLERFPRGVLNAHTGDLPRYRGNAVVPWAILRGESQVVMTVHRMAKGLDAGPIFRQQAFPMTEETCVADVFEAQEAIYPGLFLAALEALEQGDLPLTEQVGEGFRCYPRRPEDGKIDWSQSARQIHRLIRASGPPYAGAFSFLESGGRVTILRARQAEASPDLAVPGHVVRALPGGEAVVATGDGFVVIQELGVEGRSGSPAELLGVHRRLL